MFELETNIYKKASEPISELKKTMGLDIDGIEDINNLLPVKPLGTSLMSDHYILIFSTSEEAKAANKVLEDHKQKFHNLAIWCFNKAEFERYKPMYEARMFKQELPIIWN